MITPPAPISSSTFYLVQVSGYIKLLLSVLSEKLSKGILTLPLLLCSHSFILATNPY